ncbi:MAG: hypothetical protein RAP41_08475 [Candidatus Orphnella occulta]|nr:hypothetical protein [Candidatus Orphnella occulta]
MKHIFSRLSKRERYILYISAIVVVVVFFDRIVIKPLIGRIEKLNKEIVIYEKRLQRSLYLLSQEELITSEHKKYTKDIKQVSSEGEEKSRLLAEIEETARKSSVSLKDVKLGSTEKAGSYTKYTVEIIAESKVAYLVDFIYQLESSVRLLKIRSFYLVPIKEHSKTIRAQMTITETLISSEDAAPDRSDT